MQQCNHTGIKINYSQPMFVSGTLATFLIVTVVVKKRSSLLK